ncbi:MAG: amidohydrolase family protein [Planctomycetes bacterium]|nr:amidohydrolase family protein [Planctomycetota bacterium]
MRRLPPRAVLGPALLAALSATCGLARAQDVLLGARRIVVAADSVLDDGRVLIRQGKVAYVGSDIPAEARARARRVDYGDATVVPGFVLAAATLGQERDLAERALPFTPDLRAAEAFDPWHEDLLALPQYGVTSLALAPAPGNVAGGLAALVKTGRDRGTVGADLFVSLSLVPAARDQERPPTSLMGAVELLRSACDAARTGAATGPDAAVLRQAMQGTRSVFVYADNFAELNAALDLARDFGLRLVLVGAADAGKVLPRLAQQQVGVVLDSLGPEARLEQLQLPTRLAEAGVAFCFAGRPAQLRLSAALAVHHGLDRKTALQALTRVPAALLDQAATIGSLRQGCAADFVVFAGDPLDLGSAWVATWVDGELVHGTSPAASPGPQPAAEPAADAGVR